MSTSPLVLVTGGSGFIGSHIVSQLLARGSKVRAVARSEASTTGLRKRFDKEVTLGALTFDLVPDMAKDGAFDQAVKGVTGVIHAASPMPDRFKGDARKDILDPAIKGATGILRSAAKESSIKSVVLTSSAAAFTDAQGNGKVIDDDSWASASLEVAEKSDSSVVVYCAAKLLAEKAAWQTVEELNKPFRFATIGPMYVAGPTLLETQNVAQGTNNMVWSFSQGNFFGGDSHAPLPWISVHTIAAAHIAALDEPKADGKRFLVANPDSTVSPREIAKLARAVDASINNSEEPGNSKEHEKYEDYRNTNAKNILALDFPPIATTVREVVEQGLEQRKAGIIA